MRTIIFIIGALLIALWGLMGIQKHEKSVIINPSWNDLVSGKVKPGDTIKVGGEEVTIQDIKVLEKK